MDLETYIRLIAVFGSAVLGSYLTAVRGKLSSGKVKNNLHYVFYVFSAIVFVASIICLCVYWKELIKPDWFAIVILLISIIASIQLFRFTRKNLVGKHQFKTIELDPIVNKFTQNADKKNLRLLAGDLNFFGNTPNEMDNNSQYTCLRNEHFRNIQVLCLKPKNDQEKIRYGKILTDLPVELKYYNPPEADLNIRGRLKTLNNVTHLLIYNRVASKIYEAVELDTANNHGALYDHTWNLIWLLAESPTEHDIEEYYTAYKNYIK